MTKYAIANVSDIPPGERKIVELEGRNVGVFNVDGEFYALLDHCPHMGAPLCSAGTIFGTAHADTPEDEIEYIPKQSLRCPWHQWEFDIRTGVALYDPDNVRVRKYEVEVMPAKDEDDESFDVKSDEVETLVVEGFQVTVEDDMVVVDTSRRRAGRKARIHSA